MVFWSLLFFTALCCLMAWGIYRAVVGMAAKPQVPAVSIYSKPVTPNDHGRRDMLAGVYGIVYGDSGRRLMALVSVNDNPVKYIANIISADPRYLEKYAKFSHNSGRTNRMYMTASNGVDFEKYIVGGRELIDDLDRQLARIREEKEVIQARKDALSDSDRFHNLSRKELKKLQGHRDTNELKSFDDQMKEIDNDTQND